MISNNLICSALSEVVKSCHGAYLTCKAYNGRVCADWLLNCSRHAQQGTWPDHPRTFGAWIRNEIASGNLAVPSDDRLLHQLLAMKLSSDFDVSVQVFFGELEFFSHWWYQFVLTAFDTRKVCHDTTSGHVDNKGLVFADILDWPNVLADYCKLDANRTSTNKYTCSAQCLNLLVSTPKVTRTSAGYLWCRYAFLAAAFDPHKNLCKARCDRCLVTNYILIEIDECTSGAACWCGWQSQKFMLGA